MVVLPDSRFALRAHASICCASFDDGIVLYDPASATTASIGSTHRAVIQALRLRPYASEELAQILVSSANANIGYEQARHSVEELLDNLVRLDIVERIGES